jgi:transcriptional regulator GlxA family with amidase domain
VSSEPKRPVVGVLLFDRVEVLDFAGPYEVLSGARYPEGGACLEVKTISPRAQVTCNGGLRVLIDHTLDDCPPLDLIVIPGGPGADYRTPDQEQSIIPFLQRRASEVRVTASVCTGAFVLGRTGLLDGRRATTHSKLLDMFRGEFPQINTIEAKVVDEETVITAAGVSSGIDLALYLLEKWFGPEVRKRSARDLDGVWS